MRPEFLGQVLISIPSIGIRLGWAVDYTSSVENGRSQLLQHTPMQCNVMQRRSCQMGVAGAAIGEVGQMMSKEKGGMFRRELAPTCPEPGPIF